MPTFNKWDILGDFQTLCTLFEVPAKKCDCSFSFLSLKFKEGKQCVFCPQNCCFDWKMKGNHIGRVFWRNKMMILNFWPKFWYKYHFRRQNSIFDVLKKRWIFCWKVWHWEYLAISSHGKLLWAMPIWLPFIFQSKQEFYGQKTHCARIWIFVQKSVLMIFFLLWIWKFSYFEC